MNAVAVPELQTARVLLRPIQPTDAPALWPYVSDPETCRWMSWQPHTHIDQTTALVQRLAADNERGAGLHWKLLVDGQTLGLISLIAVLRQHRSLTYDRAELAYWLGSAHRGRGLMTEAGQAVIAHAFGPLGIHRLTVGHFAVNDDSKRLIERLGFRYIGQERDAFRKDGVWHDMKAYDMLVSDVRKADARSA